MSLNEEDNLQIKEIFNLPEDFINSDMRIISQTEAIYSTIIEEFITLEINKYINFKSPKFIKNLLISSDIDDWFDENKLIGNMLSYNKYLSFYDFSYLLKLISFKEGEYYISIPSLYDKSIHYTGLRDSTFKLRVSKYPRDKVIPYGESSVTIAVANNSEYALFILKTIGERKIAFIEYLDKSSEHDGYEVSMKYIADTFEMIYPIDKFLDDFKNIVKNSIKRVIIYYICDKEKVW